MSPYALASATYRHLSSELPKKKEKKKEKYDTNYNNNNDTNYNNNNDTNYNNNTNNNNNIDTNNSNIDSLTPITTTSTTTASTTTRALTPVYYLLSQTMLIQFEAAPKRIELQKSAYSHLKAFEMIFKMRLSSFL